MFENVLEVGENPDELIVYASLGKAARSWPAARAIASALLELEESETLILQSGAPVGVLETGEQAPLVLSAVNNTVGRWSDAERFYARAAAGQTMWGGLTAAAWQYIGRQGVLQGTYEPPLRVRGVSATCRRGLSSVWRACSPSRSVGPGLWSFSRRRSPS